MKDVKSNMYVLMIKLMRILAAVIYFMLMIASASKERWAALAIAALIFGVLLNPPKLVLEYKKVAISMFVLATLFIPFLFVD